MLNTLLLPYTATIRRPTIVKSWWEETRSYAIVYSSVPCRYYSWASIELWDTSLASETKKSDFRVILEPSRTDIEKWDKIDISDNDLSDIWTFIIQEVKAQRIMSSINHIYLQINRL